MLHATPIISVMSSGSDDSVLQQLLAPDILSHLTSERNPVHLFHFTDGASSDSHLLQNESFLLQSVVDQVYGFGIGAGANPEELSWIATDEREGHGWKVMSDFSNYQTFIRNFINRFGGCKTTKVQPYRRVIFFVSPF